MTNFDNWIMLDPGKTCIVFTTKEKVDALQVDLAKFLAKKKGVKIIYVTLHAPYNKLMDKFNKINVKDFFFIDATTENRDKGNVGNCIKLVKAGAMSIYLEIQKVVDYYSARNLNPPPLVILFEHFPKMTIDVYEVISLIKAMLNSNSNDISAIAVLVKEELISQEFEKIETLFDAQLTV